MPDCSPQSQQSPDNSDAFLKSRRCMTLYPQSASAHTPWQAQASISMGQVPCWNRCAHTKDTRKHYPLLGNASRKISVRILRTRMLGSKCHSVEACSHSEPSKQSRPEQTSSHQLFSPFNATFAGSSQDV